MTMTKVRPQHREARAQPGIAVELPAVAEPDSMGVEQAWWYRSDMSTTFSATVGDRGRVVLPAELRDQQGWSSGTALLFVEQAHGVLVLTPDQALTMLRDGWDGPSPVEELIRERRAAAREEDQQ